MFDLLKHLLPGRGLSIMFGFFGCLLSVRGLPLMIDVLGDLVRKRPAIKVEKETPPEAENAVGHTMGTLLVIEQSTLILLVED